MITKLMNNCLQKPQTTEVAKAQFLTIPNKSGNKEITLEFADQVLQRVIQLRHHKALEARIRFKVQDLIDEYNTKWRFLISGQKNKNIDADGFRQIYIAKDKILTEQQVFQNGKTRFGKGSSSSPQRNGSGNKYYYWPKNKDVIP